MTISNKEKNLSQGAGPRKWSSCLNWRERSSVCPCVSANCPLWFHVHGARGYSWWAPQRTWATDLPPGFVPSGKNSISTDKGSWLWRRSVKFYSQICTDDWTSCAVSYIPQQTLQELNSHPLHIWTTGPALLLVFMHLSMCKHYPCIYTHTHTPLTRRGRSLRNRLRWNSTSCEDMLRIQWPH